MKTIKFEENKTQRLDKFLLPHLPDLSRAEIQRMIKEGFILVNQNKVTPHNFLKNGDKVSVKPKPAKKIQKTKLKYKLINETKDYLIIEKPAGLIVHPANNVFEETLTDLLLQKYPNIADVGEDKTRPGIVHRLDKDVSGLMVIARTQEMFNHLKAAFQAHEIKKEYTALVHGELTRDEGIIDFTIQRAKGRGKMAANPKESDGRESKTEFDVLKRFKNYTLLKLKPKTGRTHQIRVHLKALGHSIVGDKVYRTKKLVEKIEMDKIFLHADTLGFFDLEKKWQEYKSNMPNDLNKILKEI